MLNRFLDLFRSPNFPDLEKNIRARNLHTILLSTFGLTILFLIYSFFFPPYSQVILAALAILIEIGLLVLAGSGRITLSGNILTLILWSAIVYELALYGGIRDTGFSAFVPIILIASLTMGRSAVVGYTVATLLAAITLGYAESHGWLPAYQQVSLISVFLSHSITIIAATLLLNLSIRSLSLVANKALEAERAQKEINSVLDQNRIQVLEQKVTLERQNITLQIVAELSKLSNQYNQEMDYLEKGLSILADRTNLDYVSLFLLSQNEDMAIQILCFGSGGKKLANSIKSLNVVKSEFTSGMTAIDSYQYKIGATTYFIDQPGLQSTMTQSITTPLTTGNQLLGLLNIQAMQSDNVRINVSELQAISDQLALSIQNIRLVSQLQESIKEANRQAGIQTQQSWDKYLRSEGLGYQYDRINVVPSGEKLPENVKTELLNKKHSIYNLDTTPARSRLVVPIVLRDKVIGLLGYDHNDSDHYWHPDEISLVETLASRVSMALENTRLVVEAQTRAERERTIGQLSSKIRSTLNLQTILQTAVREMKLNLNIDEAEVRLHPKSKATQKNEIQIEDAE
jgi:hypothetical protein